MPFPYKKNVFTSAILCIWSWGDRALECPQINTVVITTQALSIAVVGRRPAAAGAVGTLSGLLFSLQFGFADLWAIAEVYAFRRI